MTRGRPPCARSLIRLCPLPTPVPPTHPIPTHPPAPHPRPPHHLPRLPCPPLIHPTPTHLFDTHPPSGPHSVQYAISKEAYEILSKETDAKGRPLQIIKLPCPPPLFRTQEEWDTLVGGA